MSGSNEFQKLVKFLHKKDRNLFKQVMMSKFIVDIEQWSCKLRDNDKSLSTPIEVLKSYISQGLPIDGDSLERIVLALQDHSIKDETLNRLLAQAAIRHIYSFKQGQFPVFMSLYARLSPRCQDSAAEILSVAGYPNIKILVSEFVRNESKYSREERAQKCQKIIEYMKARLPVNGSELSRLATYSRQQNLDSLFAPILESSIHNIDLFTSYELIILADVFSEIEIANKQHLFDAIARAIIPKLIWITPTAISAIASSFNIARIRHVELFQKMSNAAKLYLSTYSCEDLARLSSVFIGSDLQDRDLFSRIEQVALRQLNKFSQNDISMLQRALPSSEYPELHKAINTLALHTKLCAEYGSENVFKDYYFAEMDKRVDFFIPSEKLIICQGSLIENPTPEEMDIWGNQQEVLHYAGGLDLRVEFVPG
jgi:hypothetical protein